MSFLLSTVNQFPLTIQLCGSNAETMTKCAQLLEENVEFDFLDINMGCPIDFIYKQVAVLLFIMLYFQLQRWMQASVKVASTVKLCICNSFCLH